MKLNAVVMFMKLTMHAIFQSWKIALDDQDYF